MTYDVVSLAHQVIEMAEELGELRLENARLRECQSKYDDLLRDSVKHGEIMMGNTLRLLLTPGVSKALADNARAASSEDCAP